MSYPGRPDVDLWYKAAGCPSVATGHLTTVALDAGSGFTSLIN